MIKADRNLMARMLVAAQTRDLDLRLVLSHELGPIPWSIANADDSLVKTAKATLLSVLEKDVPPPEYVPADATRIVNAMALLQAMVLPTAVQSTFAEIAMNVCTTATEQAFRFGSLRVDFEVDQYLPASIKIL